MSATSFEPKRSQQSAIEQSLNQLTSIFHSLDDGQCFVICSMVLCVGIMIQDTWPNHCSTNFGLHGDPKITKVGASSLLDIIEIQKD